MTPEQATATYAYPDRLVCKYCGKPVEPDYWYETWVHVDTDKEVCT